MKRCASLFGAIAIGIAVSPAGLVDGQVAGAGGQGGQGGSQAGAAQSGGVQPGAQGGVAQPGGVPVGGVPVGGVPVGGVPVGGVPVGGAQVGSATAKKAGSSSAKAVGGVPVGSAQVGSATAKKAASASDKAASAKAGDAKASGAKASGTKASNTKAGGAMAGGSKADGAKADGAKVAGTPVAGTPAAGTPAYLNAERLKAVAGTPVDGTPAAETPVRPIPAAGTPVAGTPVAGTPVAGTPVAGTPVAGTPVAGTPVAGTPVAGTPVAGTPAVGVQAGAQAQAGANNGGVGQTPWFNPQLIRRQLNLNDEQFEQLNRIYDAGPPVAETPVAETPVAGTPVAGTPIRPFPATGTPATGTPATSIPATSTPAADTPAAATPVAGTPADGVQAGAQAQAGANIGGVRQTPWFNPQLIRRQLNLNNEQFNVLNRSYADSWNRYNQGMSETGTDLNDPQRMQRMRELEGTFQRDFKTTVDRAFTDASQRQRFNQLYLQYQGYGALNDPTIQQRLKLTPQQSQQLNAMNTVWNTQMGIMGTEFRPGDEGINSRFRLLRKQYDQRFNTILNDQQRQSWQIMVGEPFDFPVETFFQSKSNVETGNQTGARAGQTNGAQVADQPTAPQIAR